MTTTIQNTCRPWFGAGELLESIAADTSKALDLYSWPAWVVAGEYCDRPGVVIAHALRDVPSDILDLVQNAVRKRLPYYLADVRVTSRPPRVRRVDLPGTVGHISVAVRHERSTACGSCGMREVRDRLCAFCGGRA